MENDVRDAAAVPAPPSSAEPDVAARVARQTLARRHVDSYTNEVRRLLDAALEVMQQRGTESRPRVADIVAAAGLSNDAFYRHFPSKDALVTTLLEDGAERLRGYLAHQMAKDTDPADRVRRWVRGILSQAEGDVAGTTLAVLWNGSAAQGVPPGRHFASAALATLLHEPLAELGSPDPEVAGVLAAHAVLGRLTDHLWQQTTPDPDEVEVVVAFCMPPTVTDRS